MDLYRREGTSVEQVSSGPVGESSGVLGRFNFQRKAMKHLPVLDANLEEVTKGPVSVAIHPTNACNAKCPMCRYADLRETNETIPLDVLMHTVKNLGEMGTKSIILSGGGEPIIYNGLPEVIELASSYGMKIGLITNFIRVGDRMMKVIVDNLSWIRISINAASGEAYKVVQGMEPRVFPKLLENIRALVKLRNERQTKLVIGASYIVQKGNYREVGDFLDLCTDLRVDYVLYRPVQKWSPTASLMAGSLALSREDIEEMKTIAEQKLGEGGRMLVPNNLDKIVALFFKIDEVKDYPKCLSTLVQAAVGGDGKVYPCCQHVGNTVFSAGSILDKPFKEIWTSVNYNKVRDSIVPRACPPCRYHFYNTVFNKYVGGWRPDPEEVSFSTETPDVDFL